MGKEVRRKRNFSGSHSERVLGEGYAPQGHPEQVEALDIDLAFEFVACILGGQPWQAFHEQKIEAKANECQVY
jgi:hypothetical protein